MVSRIAEISMNNKALWISDRVDEKTAKRPVIAVNGTRKMLRMKVCLRQQYPGKYKRNVVR